MNWTIVLEPYFFEFEYSWEYSITRHNPEFVC